VRFHRDSWLIRRTWSQIGSISLAGALLATAAPAGAQHNHGSPPSTPPATTSPRPTEKADEERGRVIELTITDEGFQPATIRVRKGERIRLVLLRLAKDKCAEMFSLDEFLVWRRLPIGRKVTEAFVTSRTGDFPFECTPGSETGVFRVEE
jgi:plastocyanin